MKSGIVETWANCGIVLLADDQSKALALGPMDDHDITPHDSVFLNELKLSDFKQVLMKNNISSEFAGGVLWCCNGTLALKRVSRRELFIHVMEFKILR